jgi:hypothetical protein
MFKSEFQPEAIAAMAETADRFGSVEPYLLRLRTDVLAELAEVAVTSEQGTVYAKQFVPARARECFIALSMIDRYLAQVA